MGSNSNSATENTKHVTTNTDKRLVVDGGSLGISSDNSTVFATSNNTAIDAGAVRAGAQVAFSALDTIAGADAMHAKSLDSLVGLSYDSLDRVAGFAGEVLRGGFEALQTSQQLTADAYQTATAEKSGSIDNKTMAILGVAAAVAVAIASRG